MAESSTAPSSAKKPATSNAEMFCYFTIAFAGYLFATKPATTTAQLVFRLLLVIGGLVGLMIIRQRKNAA